MKKLLIASIVLTALSGCATKPVHVTPSPISGSKSDATVVVAYTYNVGPFFPRTIPNWAEATKIVRKRCAVWGYSDAERFGDFANNTCQRTMVNSLTGQLDCTQYLSKVTYQCID